jgi:competence ComEA-like helix-hairpin-helix protein
MRHTIYKLGRAVARHTTSALAIATLVGAMGGTWSTASAAPAASPPPPAHLAAQPGTITPLPDEPAPPRKSKHKDLTGKVNLNTATEEQLQLLPTVGPSKAERIVEWRKKNGGFKRTADLRRVKGFGYKTFKRLEPLLDIKGETTLAAH